VIVIDGKEFIPEDNFKHLAPEEYWHKRRYLVGKIGSIELWQVKEFYFWKNGTGDWDAREAKLTEALRIIKDDLSDESLAANDLVRRVRNFANDASQ